MSIDFVAIDFETANQNRASACSIGLTKVVNSKIIDNYYSLIDPEDYFDSFNSMIHGISESDIIGAPKYPDVINDIKKFIGKLPLVAHYAPFDMGVIRNSNERYGITDFTAKYFDSYYLSKQYLSLLSYKLNFICHSLDIKFDHHNAAEDSRACAELVLYLCNSNNFNSVQALLDGARYNKMGTVINFEGSSFRRNNSSKYKNKCNTIDIKELISSVDRSTLDPAHPFFDSHACFTGKLESMTRNEAMKVFAGFGGFPEKGVNKKVNYLVMGEQDLRVVGENLKSSKVLKAEKLLNEGQKIQLLSENEFLMMMEN